MRKMFFETRQSVILTIVGSVLTLGMLESIANNLQDSGGATQPPRLSQIYGEGYDGADVKAVQAAWASFVKTEGLRANDKRMERYWFQIENDKTHRIVEVLPKVTSEDYDDPSKLRSHWPFGTSGKFWVHKATYEVDKTEVVPPPFVDDSDAD